MKRNALGCKFMKFSGDKTVFLCELLQLHIFSAQNISKDVTPIIGRK